MSRHCVQCCEGGTRSKGTEPNSGRDIEKGPLEEGLPELNRERRSVGQLERLDGMLQRGQRKGLKCHPEELGF